MRLNGFRCDNCGKEYLVAKRAFQDNALPDGWFMVGSDKYEGQEPMFFCSKQCLAAWANRKPIEVEDLIRRAEDVSHEPYPYCCAEHYPLPERRKS